MKPLGIFTRTSLLIISGLLFLNSFSQDQPATNSSLFQSDEILKLTLKMDIKTVLRDIGDERQQHEATVTYYIEDNAEVSVPVKVRTRGHFRRDPMNCDFPPLRLNFASETSKETLFEGQDKIKLVTHCRTRGNKYEQNVIKEYLAYKLYNLLTEESLRVRLFRMHYVDMDGKKDTLARMGFFIEPVEQMARRNGKNHIEIKNVKQGQCQHDKALVMSVFQYMIGNTDWSVPGDHNVILLQAKPSDPPVPVPFDFDWCGMVNAPYATPSEILGIEDVTTRLFRGICSEDEEYEATFQIFRDKKQDFYSTIREVPYLSDREKGKIIKYMDQFYKVINNQRMARNEFHNNCLNY